MFNRIVVPLDTSPLAEKVLPSVIQLASAFKPEIDLLVVCEQDSGEAKTTCTAYLDDQIQKILTSLPGQEPRIRSVMVDNLPAPGILAYADSVNADLIVMASHGTSGVMMFPMGGTVSKVLHTTTRPVLFVDIKDEEAVQAGLFKKILVLLDGSTLAEAVMPHIIEIADRFASEVILLNVIVTDKPVHALGRLDTVPIREREMEMLVQRSREYLSRQKARFENSKASVSTITEKGNAAEAIIKYAQTNRCSLICLSSQGRSGLSSFMIGSVTNKILHAGNKSLFFVPVRDQA